MCQKNYMCEKKFLCELRIARTLIFMLKNMMYYLMYFVNPEVSLLDSFVSMKKKSAIKECYFFLEKGLYNLKVSVFKGIELRHEQD